MKNARHYSFLDKVCLGIDRIFRDGSQTQNAYPAEFEKEPDLTLTEKKHISALMRINHSGEVCAQALYQAQALVSRSETIKEKMHQAAIEEKDHLAWCKMRLDELNNHTSYLNPIWYLGSFIIGIAAGIAGDEWSLGFLAETENQVVAHLENHLKQIPSQDTKTYKILKKMQQDEAEHCHRAIETGAKELPQSIKNMMRITSQLMVKTAYWI